MKLKNKIAIITGASTGIGRAIAVKLASEGAKTMLLARSKDGLEKTLLRVLDTRYSLFYKLCGCPTPAVSLRQTSDIPIHCI